MRVIDRVAVAAAILFAVSSLSAVSANAQQRMSTPVARGAVVHARPAAAHPAAGHLPAGRRVAPAPHAAVHFNTATNSFESDDGSFVSLEELLNPVPGLGFDYHHLSVINQDLPIKALIDPVTEMKIAEARRFRRHSRSGGSGYFFLNGGGYYPVPDDSDSGSPEPAPTDSSAQQQPQVIVVQAPAAAQQEADNSQVEPPDAAPLPDVGQFTLVLRNGKQLEAVAFTRMNDQIVYITTDGNRRTIAVGDLNAGATVRINEERGTPLQLHL
jgi:hypothetical protein